MRTGTQCPPPNLNLPPLHEHNDLYRGTFQPLKKVEGIDFIRQLQGFEQARAPSTERVFCFFAQNTQEESNTDAGGDEDGRGTAFR